MATKTQGSRPVLFYVAPSGANSNPLKIHISSHAARNAKSGSNSRGYRHNELNYQLPSVLFSFKFLFYSASEG